MTTEPSPDADGPAAPIRAQGAAGAAWTVAGGLVWLIGAYVATQFAAPHAWSRTLVALVAVPGSAWLIFTRFTSAGRKRLAVELARDWTVTAGFCLTLFAVSTAGFTAASVWLAGAGVGRLTGAPVDGPRLVRDVYESYLWHFTDSIPALKIPETAGWTLGHHFTDAAQGTLLVVYELVVTVPLLFVATKLVVRFTTDPEPVDEQPR